MRTLTSLFSFALIAVALAVAAPQAASADERGRNDQGYDQRGYDQRGGGLPDGNYQDSCRDIRADGGRLTARCRTNGGYYNPTSLDLRSCRDGYVENHNGNLVCTGSSGGGYGGGYGNNGRNDRWDDNGYRDLPNGGYRDSCRDIRIDRGVLSAYCRDKYNNWHFTSINLRDCRGGDIENKRGTLVCRR